MYRLLARAVHTDMSLALVYNVSQFLALHFLVLSAKLKFFLEYYLLKNIINIHLPNDILRFLLVLIHQVVFT